MARLVLKYKKPLVSTTKIENIALSSILLANILAVCFLLSLYVQVHLYI